jgi:hypothetical protein
MIKETNESNDTLAVRGVFMENFANVIEPLECLSVQFVQASLAPTHVCHLNVPQSRCWLLVLLDLLEKCQNEPNTLAYSAADQTL